MINPLTEPTIITAINHFVIIDNFLNCLDKDLTKNPWNAGPY